MEPLKVLLVEDNDGDILLTTEAFEESKLFSIVAVMKDGKDAVNYFETRKEANRPPDLVLLDINLPKMSGHEVLSYLKHSEKYKHIPVIMLTTSSSERDIMRSYKNYANCYITKPGDILEFMQAVTKIEDFWINIVSVPKLNEKDN
jgi:CheY-like chemotaxis protein